MLIIVKIAVKKFRLQKMPPLSSPAKGQWGLRARGKSMGIRRDRRERRERREREGQGDKARRARKEVGRDEKKHGAEGRGQNTEYRGQSVVARSQF